MSLRLASNFGQPEAACRLYLGQLLTIKILWSSLRNYGLGSALDNIGCLEVIPCIFVAGRQN